VGETAQIVVTAPGNEHVAAPARLERADDPRAQKTGAAGHEHATVVPEAARGHRAHPIPAAFPGAVGGEASWRSVRIFSRGRLSRTSSATCSSGWSKAATITPSHSSPSISPIARTGKPKRSER